MPNQQWFRYNRFLSELPTPLIERLLPHLNLTELKASSTILAPGEIPKEIFFPLSCVVSLQRISLENQITEICMVGNEGAVGLLDWLYSGEHERQIAVLHAGLALRLPLRELIAQVGESVDFQRYLLIYQRKVLSYLAEVSFCNQFHSVDQRLARWLHGLFHQIAGRELLLTQEQIAHALGVRRESIAVALGHLERQGLLDTQRRRIVLLDETALKQMACTCLSSLWAQDTPVVPLPAESHVRIPGVPRASAIGITRRAS